MKHNAKKDKNKFEEVKMRELDKRKMLMSLKDEADTMIMTRDKKHRDKQNK